MALTPEAIIAIIAALLAVPPALMIVWKLCNCVRAAPVIPARSERLPSEDGSYHPLTDALTKAWLTALASITDGCPGHPSRRNIRRSFWVPLSGAMLFTDPAAYPDWNNHRVRDEEWGGVDVVYMPAYRGAVSQYHH